MDVFSSLMDGFATALTPMNFLYAVIGVVLGTAVGVLPGIGPAMTVALLLPVTYALEPISAFIMFAGIYYGGMYGGSTTSILLNTPGESSSVVTAIEGNKMAKAGRAAQALATAAIGSFVAGTIGTTLLAVCAPIVVKFAVSLGSPSYFAIMVLALLAVTAVLGSSRLRGFASLGLGLAIGLVGMDSVTGQARLTFGQPLLADGLDIVVVAVAIFAVGEALWVAAHLRRTPLNIIPVGQPWMGKEDWKRSWKPWLRGTAFGFPFGALPAGGAEIPTFLSYVTEKRLSKHPEEFGKGAIEGVAGPEAANNAAAAGTLTPMLALGLPTNATAAVMLAAFTSYGIQPGPQLFESQGPLVWALIASLFIGNFLLLIINLPLAPLWARLLQLPRPYLYAGILFFATLGAYSVNLQAFDLVILLVLGALGFMMRRFGLPVLPLILGVILGPRIEGQLRKTLQLSAGDPSGLWSEPIAVGIYILVAIILIWPLLLKLWRRSRPAAGMPGYLATVGPASMDAAALPAEGVHGEGARREASHRDAVDPDAVRSETVRSQTARPDAEHRSVVHHDAVHRSVVHHDAGRPRQGEAMSIVVGYVPTPEGSAALDHAIAEARKSGKVLVVINSSRGDALVDKRYADQPEIDSVEDRLGREGIEHVILQPVRGHDAANEVLEAADDHDAELIVIGLRRRTPVGKLIMGSTAQRILLEASCPVLAVKAGMAG